MTIKKRLTLSNTLMFIIPLLASFIFVFMLTMAMMNILGIGADYFSNSRDYFNEASEALHATADKLAIDSPDTLREDIDAIWRQYGRESLSIGLYLDGERVYTAGVFPDTGALITAALNDPGGHFYAVDKTAVYTLDVRAYKIILTDTNYPFFRIFNNPNNRRDFYIPGFVIIGALFIIINITNRVLTRLVFKSIITPLDTLVYGVHEIRDGHLNYRIAYTGKDEFAPVCDDFNEMAERLSDMVSARLMDEKNRKELIAGISHDLRTPLTAIKTYVEGLEIGLAATPQMRDHYLATIKRKTNELEHIINQLFLFAKLDFGEFPLQAEDYDMGGWLNDCVCALSNEYAPKGLSIILTENVSGMTVHVDSVQLRNVFTNIVENSLKYGSREQGIIRVACRADGGSAVITLTDNGPGVNAEDIALLFDVFYRGDRARSNTSQGSGLGLAISAKIMERLGGGITAKNAPEGGLAVTLTLPVR